LQLTQRNYPDEQSGGELRFFLVSLLLLLMISVFMITRYV
jgi:hypothetical protein